MSFSFEPNNQDSPLSIFEDNFSLNSEFEIPKSSLENSSDAIGVFVDLSDDSSTPPSREQEEIRSNNDEAKSITVSQFPDVDKCIPRWKDIFPWVFWFPEKGILYCKQCRDILRTYIPGQVRKGVIINIAKPDDVFLVARLLRKHNDSDTHSISNCLSCSSTLVTLISFYNNTHADLNDTAQLISAAKIVLNDPNIQQESFIKITKWLGSFAENAIIEDLRSAKYFSIVADQCRGLIITRFLNKDDEPEEHVLWTYISIWDMTPLTYLNTLDLNFEKMVIYIANIPCQQCRRCTSNRITLANLPPRPPSTISFSRLLWNLDFFKPLVYILETVHKLWKVYPYKFSKTFSTANFKALESFYTNPGVLVDIIKNFDAIKEICSQIYQGRFILEALGITMVEVQSDERHLKILTILQEIIDIARETSKPDKSISDKEIVKLNQALSSLKFWSSKAQFVSVKNTQPICNPKSNSDKVWEFLNLVEKFIDENQKGIYYNGRESTEAFFSLCCIDLFFESGRMVCDRKNINKYFEIVYEALTPFLSNSVKEDVMKCLIDFYSFASYQGIEIKSCLDALKYLAKQPSQQIHFALAYNFFLLMATLPFQPCYTARSLFGSFVIEQKLDNSIWNKFKDDLKPSVLYIQQKPIFTHRNILTRWAESFDPPK